MKIMTPQEENKLTVCITFKEDKIIKPGTGSMMTPQS
jgi:hypothetical protein